MASVTTAVARAIAATDIGRGDIVDIGIDIGITSARPTVIWDRPTGEAIHNSIVWQYRQTAGACALLKDRGHELMARPRTGLVLDPYSATRYGSSGRAVRAA